MMKRHVKSMTYPPKIDAVIDGRCTQTIRAGRKVSVGDEILFHGWEGRPYRSKWSWRKRVVVTESIDIMVFDDGIAKPYYGNGPWISGPICHWVDSYCDHLAALDFIDPPTGEALRDVLFGLNKVPDEPQEYQIIRW